jgi:hypothetical protein
VFLPFILFQASLVSLKAKSQKPKAKSQKPKAKSQKPKAKSQKPKAKSRVLKISDWPEKVPQTNTLAYFVLSINDKEKSFMKLTPGVISMSEQRTTATVSRNSRNSNSSSDLKKIKEILY